MAPPTLHTDVANNPETLKLFIAAKLSNRNINVVHRKKDERIIPYLSKTQLPVLELAKDDFLFSANSATRYLLSGDVVLNDANIDTQVDMWLQWEACQLQSTVKDIISIASGKNVSKEDNGPNLALLHSHLKYMEEKLKRNDNNLVKGQMTAADVTVWSTLYHVFNQTDIIKDWEKNYPKVSSWFKCLSGKKDFQDGVNQLTDSQRTVALTESVCKSNQKSSKATWESKSESKHQGDQKPKSLTSKLPLKPAKQPENQEAANDVLVNSNEISKSVAAWKLPLTTNAVKREHPILPVPGARNILITSALPYVNNVPHLGNIIGSTLSADIFSRYSQLRGYNCLYICGTDEYGTATETKAMEEGLTPQQICDKYNVIHEEIYKWFHISFDYFGRTTTKLQTEIAQDIFWKLHKKGYISEDTVDQLKCEKCDRFLADRFVEGICPLCGFDDARGDQCDKCGKLINAIDLVKPRCKTCSNTPIVKSSRHLFLDLPKLEPDLKKHLENVFPKGIWTNNAKVITNSWLRDGLKPRCISRDLKWGTPVPLKGFTDKVFYVWFDAPIGYISITANYTEKWEKWWKNPSQVQMYNFLGKDNVPFHSVIFPATLLGANQNYTLVDSVLATEYLNYEDGKFSKSRGVGVFGNNAKDTGIPADIFRFYLVYMRPESQDTSFSWDDFQLKNNCELLNNIGNFINRALMFISNSFQQTIQAMDLIEGDEKLIAQINKLLHRYIENMECTKMRDSLRILLEMSTLGNQYMQMHKPWVLVKGTNEEKQRAGTIVSLSSNIAALLSVLLQPFMPQTSATIQLQMQFPPEKNVILNNFSCYLLTGHKIGKPRPLFQKLETDFIQGLKKKFCPSPTPTAAASNKTDQAAAATLGSEADVDTLNQLVTEQGLKVRELKANKAEKSVIDGEVAKLLDLKRQLALKQGIDPASLGNKKKNKKK
ncbi:methionine--tRNA ligase, cytoplasmic [Octopus sinensis]|uniref:Methionine--tRNA ligase, cytoplasmic n=1 Tax=Octopus sinensis TaxID=2607531 RepID=A0A6P7T9C8_9MOLL|nr:methionine--tRNA ligase, cytoplasmic [Octopus sinensis]